MSEREEFRLTKFEILKEFSRDKYTNSRMAYNNAQLRYNRDKFGYKYHDKI